MSREVKSFSADDSYHLAKIINAYAESENLIPISVSLTSTGVPGPCWDEALVIFERERLE